MLSNFGMKKSDKDETPVSAQATAGAAMPPPSPGQSQAAGARPAARPGERTAPSLIGQDLTIIGNLVSKGEVHVEGEVQGDIHGTNILIGENARITGGIIAQDVVVRGHVMGSVRGVKVALQASSHVEGDIYHKSLAIEQGAFFEGRSRRADDPTAGVKVPEAPPMPPSANANNGAQGNGQG